MSDFWVSSLLVLSGAMFAFAVKDRAYFGAAVGALTFLVLLMLSAVSLLTRVIEKAVQP